MKDPRDFLDELDEPIFDRVEQHVRTPVLDRVPFGWLPQWFMLRVLRRGER